MDDGPLPLRAHNVLCLQGFRGRGYSEAFVEQMAEIHAALGEDPGHEVVLLDTPDLLCLVCPHLEAGCTLGGPDHEAHMQAQDRDVLKRLGLEVGDVVTWAEVLERIGEHIRGADLPTICTTCPWLRLGWCESGVDALGP